MSTPPVKPHTLCNDRRYFGLDPIRLRTAAMRVVARVAGLPPERARVRATALRQDFGVDTVEARALFDDLIAEGMIERPAAPGGDFVVTPRMVALASARIVEPLPRARAKAIVARACELAAQVNREWSRNPLEIDAVVPHGAYMSREPRLDVLPLGFVVRLRPVPRRARWNVLSKSDGAAGLRTTFCELSSFVRVRLATELDGIPRPFCVAWQADDE